MNVEIINLPKQKTWGVLDHPFFPGHFYTGYDRGWERPSGISYDTWYDYYHGGHPAPYQAMEVGRNVIITGDFCVVDIYRGQSAANFLGHFRGHPEVEYQFGMSGILALISLIQLDKVTPVDGHLSGSWTFAKQGSNMFLKPYQP